MTLETAEKIYEQIDCSNLVELKEDLFKAAVRYARIRTDWYLSDADKRKELDDTRRACHNVLIDSCNILSRNMAKIGEDNSWRETLGNDRKVIGDFACYLHCILGLRAG